MCIVKDPVELTSRILICIFICICLLAGRMLVLLVSWVLLGGAGAEDRNFTTGALDQPNPRDCANRIRQTQFSGHNYFFSWEYSLTKAAPLVMSASGIN